jgi:hypothetical protein
MGFLLSFLIGTSMALVNLPGVLQGNMLSIASMIFCSSLAIFSLVMAAVSWRS